MTNEEKLLSYTLHGQLEEILKLLKENEVNINACSNGYTALLLASFNGHAEIVKYLIENGANINVSVWGHTALHLAIMLGNDNNITIVKLLLSAEIDYQKRNRQGKTALDLARQFGMSEIVACLEIDERGIPAYLNQLHQSVSSSIHESVESMTTELPQDINHMIMSYTFKFFKFPKTESIRQAEDNEQYSAPSLN